MTTTSIRISSKPHQTVQQLAQQAGLSMRDIVEQAVELYRRTQLHEAANLAYAIAHSDQALWQEMDQKQANWDVTLNDGLPEDYMPTQTNC